MKFLSAQDKEGLTVSKHSFWKNLMGHDSKKKTLMGRHSISCNFAGSWLIFGFLKNAVQPRLMFYLRPLPNGKDTQSPNFL